MSEAQSPSRLPALLFTGLSGSGKSTICGSASEALRKEGVNVYCLDGDAVRTGLCSDLGYGSADRFESLRRIAHVARMLCEHDAVVFIAAIAPMAKMRLMMGEIIPDLREVFVSAPLAICEERDPKGLYAKARAGMLTEFTGISAPFEEPQRPALVCHTSTETVEVSTLKVTRFVRHLLEARNQLAEHPDDPNSGQSGRAQCHR